MGFRLLRLQLTLVQFKGNGEGYAYFTSEYLENCYR